MLALPLLAPAWLAGCGSIGGPGLDELNATHDIDDPNVDDTPAAAPFVAGQRRDVGDADAVLRLEALPESLEGVVSVGDLDGDGLGDLALLVRRHNPPDVVPCEDGCPAFAQSVTYLVYGARTLDATLAPAAELVGWHLNDLRHSVAAAGDVDGDGLSDLAISIGSIGCDQGNVLVVRGGPRMSGTHDVRDVGALVRESGTCARLGDGVGVGDLDGDGHDEVVVATPGTDRAFLFYGTDEVPPPRRSEENAEAVFVGASIGAARGVGDVNGDGLADLVLGVAPSTVQRLTDERTHVMIFGAATRMTGEQALLDAPHLEAAIVRGVGDVTGDGIDDLGATVTSGPHGAFVIAGRPSWPSTLDVRASEIRIAHEATTAPNEAATIVGAGDVDGDGHDDLLYGVPAYEGGIEAPRGAVHLFRGPIAGTRTLEDATTFLGQLWRGDLDDAPRGADELGRLIVGDVDLDGDGLDDLVLPAPTAPEGRVYVWRGRRS
ncbi:MAG: VCBS repeat-containing protein [Deltaproteobacteria bacterium]|nr:VCBS repeat-containing protein [Deltaproteobacteria bacterium]